MRESLSIGLLALVLLTAPPPSLGAEEEWPGHVIPDTPQERTAHPAAEAAARKIRCDCGCPPQSAWECACGNAARMVGEMHDQAVSGLDAEGILQAWIDEEGLGILMAPPMSGWNLTGWLGPGLVLLIAAAVLAATLRAWQRRARGETAPAGTAPTPEEEAYRERIDREMARLDEGRAP